jgi:N-acetylneuraminic acid mutarotase
VAGACSASNCGRELSKRMKTRLLMVSSALLVVLLGGLAFLLVGPGSTCSAALGVAAAPTGAWTARAALPTARSEIAVTVLDEQIYIAGGLHQFSTLRAFEVYDAQQDHWQELAPLPVGLHHAGIAAVGGRIYITGGYHDLSFTPQRATWVYDRATNTWAKGAPLPAPRAAHTMAAVENKLYVVGGVPESTALWRYDPSTNTWDTSAAPMPTAREHLTSVVVDGKIYSIGGRWEARGNLGAVEVYDPATNAWQRRQAMPTSRGGLAAAALNGRIYVAGGEKLDRAGLGCVYSRVEVYDPAADSWAILPDLPTPRHGLAAAAAGGRWYVIGGATKAGLRTLFSTTSATIVWTPGEDGSSSGAEAKVAKFAGFKWWKTTSAEHQREETPLTHRENRYLRS